MQKCGSFETWIDSNMLMIEAFACEHFYYIWIFLNFEKSEGYVHSASIVLKGDLDLLLFDTFYSLGQSYMDKNG